MPAHTRLGVCREPTLVKGKTTVRKRIGWAERLLAALVAMAALVFPAAVAAHAANTTVTCTGNTVNDGDSLVAAIAAAATGDTITLDSYCLYTLTTGYLGGGSGLPPIIGKSLTIVGNNATIERQTGAPNFRILQVGVASGGTGQLTMDHVTLINRLAPTSNDNGGGIYVTETSTFTGTEVSMRGNNAAFGAGIEIEIGSVVSLTGGHITDNRTHNSAEVLIDNAGAGIGLLSANLTTNGVTVDLNRSETGAGVYMEKGDSLTAQTAQFTGGSIKNNTASSRGGGIALGNFFGVAGTALTLSGTSITDNKVIGTSGRGDGISTAGGTATLTMTGGKVSGNNIASESGQDGVMSVGATDTVTVNGTEFAANRTVGANSQGGGLWNAGTLSLGSTTPVTVSANKVQGRYSQGAGIWN